jgi:hypothetical protein
MHTRILVPALAVLLTTVLAPSQASAHYKSDKRWEFSGATTGAPDSRNKIDPVTVFLYPWAIRYSNQGNLGKFARANDHLSEHVRPKYAHDEDMPVNKCRDHQYVGFPARSEPRETNDFGWMSYNSQSGPYDSCRTRYHARVWYDDHHGDSGHASEANTWIIASLHHERNNLVRWGKPHGHWIDADWDTVEYAYIRKMRSAGRSTTEHLDPRGRGAGLGHCADYRWKPLPGSRGWFGGVADTDGRPGSRRSGYFSDGWISRISMNHCGRS